MSVVKYEENGKVFWRVQIHVRSSKNRKIRVQKRLTRIEAEQAANEIFRREYQLAIQKLAKRETLGLTWGELLESWELFLQKWPSRRWDKKTVQDYVSVLHRWTKHWMETPCRELTLGDGYELIELMRKADASVQQIYHVKTVVNVIFGWGIQHGKIVGKDHSPVYSIELKKRESETVPEILAKDEVSLFLKTAERKEHDWYPIWFFDLYTGLRASEIEGLRRCDLEMVSESEAKRLDALLDSKKNYGFIRVQRQWKKHLNGYGELKGRMWRSVPVSSRLYWFLQKLSKDDFGKDEIGERVFPLKVELRRGQQASVLRMFCEANGLKSIKFHTLRACFATHLLAAGVSEIQVMKIGGWKDRETMMIYIRRAGIEESGATEALDFGHTVTQAPQPQEASEMGNVVRLFGRN